MQEEAAKAGAAGTGASPAGGDEVAALVDSATTGQGPALGGGAPLAKQLQLRQPPKTYIGPDASTAGYVNQVCS